MQQNLRLGDWAMILVYSLLMLAIGIYCIRFSRKGINYFAGGRRIPWWLSGVSAWMSAFSAYVFVGLASQVYKLGVAPLVHVLYGMSFAWFVGMFLWAERWRKTGVITVPEFMETRFSLSTRQVFAWAVTPFRIGDDGVKCYATAKILGFVFGVPLWASILGLSLLTVGYTMLGGLWAVMITDLVQFVILALVLLVVLPVGLAKIGGLSGLAAGAPEGFFRVFHPFESYNGDFTVWFFIAMWVMTPLLYNGSFSLVQRYTTVPTPRDARRSARLSMWLGIVFFPLVIGPPLISRVLYGDALMAGTSLMETSYIKLCVDLLPVGMIGLVAVALMAATMSSLAGDYNIYGAVLTNDLYHRLLNRKASATRLAVVGKLNTLLVGGLALLVAASVERLGGAFGVMMTILGMIGGPTTIPILLGIWIRRPGPGAAIVSCLSGLAFGALAKYGLGWSYAPFVLGNVAVTAGVFLLIGWFRPVRGAVKARVDDLFDRVLHGGGENGAAFGDEESAATVVPSPEDSAAPSPFYIVGWILGAIGACLALVGLASGSAHAALVDALAALALVLLGWFLVRRGRGASLKRA